jgi:hypothetical protein
MSAVKVLRLTPCALWGKDDPAALFHTIPGSLNVSKWYGFDCDPQTARASQLNNAELPRS